MIITNTTIIVNVDIVIIIWFTFYARYRYCSYTVRAIPDITQEGGRPRFITMLLRVHVLSSVTENAKFWPVLANFGYFVADKGPFCRTFAGVNNVVVPTLAIIRYTTVLDFFMLFMWC